MMSARKLTLTTLCTMVGILAVSGTGVAQAEQTHFFKSTFNASDGPAPLVVPVGLAVDDSATASNGTVYVGDQGARPFVVDRFDSKGKYLSQLTGANTVQKSFEVPYGLAIDQTNGDLYVADLAHHVVDKFKPGASEAVETAFGEGGQVSSKQITAVEPNALGAEGHGELFTPAGVGVDPKTGDLYVGDAANAVIDVFDPSGKYLRQFATSGGAIGIALDSQGNLFAANASETDVYVAATGILNVAYGTGLGQLDTGGSLGVAVDPANDDVYVADGEHVDQYDKTGALVSSFGSGHLTGAFGVGVGDTAASVYTANSGAADVAIFGLTVVIPDVATAAQSAVTPASVTLNGTVNPDKTSVSVCRFEYGSETGVYPNVLPCSAPYSGSPPYSGEAPLAAAATASGLSPDTTYHYRLFVENENGASATPDAIFNSSGPLRLESTSSEPTPEGATLVAHVNTEGYDTHYHFEYGETSAYGTSIPVPDGDIAAGFTEQTASATVTGLRSGRTGGIYHYRVVVSSAAGPPVDGPDQEFVTAPTPVDTSPTFSDVVGLPDGRVYEQVSPSNKSGNSARVGEDAATADGNGILFGGNGPMGDAASGDDRVFVAQRTSGGWSTRSALSREKNSSGQNAALSQGPFVTDPSADLSHLVFSSNLEYERPDNVIQVEYKDNIYLAGPSPHVPDVWVGRPLISNPVEGASLPIPVGGSPDLSTLYFVYQGTLLPADAGRLPSPEGYGFSPGLYEYRDGVLSEAGVLPDGSVPVYGAEPAGISWAVHTEYYRGTGPSFNQLDNEVSLDGRRVFFTSGGELYVHITAADGSQSTVLVSQSQLPGQVGKPAPDGVLTHEPPQLGDTDNNALDFYASPDGSHAFFASTDQLTSDAPGDTSSKEYDFDVDTGVLTYIPDVASRFALGSEANGGRGKGREEIVASAPDGSWFLFVDSVSSPAELDRWTSGPGGGSVRSLVQIPIVREGNEFADYQRAAYPVRVSSDGSVIVFSSSAAIAGFNNGGGGLPEVYRYDVQTSGLSCVSCPPEGVAPGAATFAEARSLAGMRGISADGSRVFFQTGAPLVTQAPAGGVYEWENGSVYLIAPNASLMDNSESGSDVFFTTVEGLVAGDTDGGSDVYDARIPHPGDNPPVSAVPCQGSVCQGPPRVPAPLGAPASATFSGLENPVSSTSTPAVKKKAAPKAKKCKKGYVKKKNKCLKAKPKRKSNKKGRA
jgi:sugar lactone lactonase YvrE